MKNISKLIIAAFLLMAYSLNVQAIEEVSSQQAATLVSEHKAVIIDVREEDEWQQQHIEGAVHLPLGQLNTHLKDLEVYKNTAIITQCRSGKRSAAALEILKAAGFTRVYNMEGGIQAWEKAGLPMK